MLVVIIGKISCANQFLRQNYANFKSEEIKQARRIRLSYYTGTDDASSRQILTGQAEK